MIILAVIPFSSGNAEIFSWTDEEGRKYFSNIRHPADARELVRVEEIEYEPVPEKSGNETEGSVVAKESFGPESQGDNHGIFYADAVSSERIKTDSCSKDHIDNNRQTEPEYVSENLESNMAASETRRAVYSFFPVYGVSMGFAGNGRSSFSHHRDHTRDRRYNRHYPHFSDYRHRSKFGDGFFRYPEKYRRDKLKSRHPDHRYNRHLGTEKSRKYPNHFRNQFNRNDRYYYPEN